MGEGSRVVEVISDIVGEESMMGRRTQTGAILEMMDVCAARVAYKHARCNVVTAAVDVVVLFHPVLHQDLVKMEGRIASLGGSSMVIQVKAFRQDIPSRDWQLVLCGYVTTVAINKDGTPKKDLPPPQYESPEEEAALLAEVKRRRDLSTQWTQLQERVNVSDLTIELVEDEANRGKKEYLTMDETIVTVKRNFFPKHVNINNTVFGGEIMFWMDRVAIQCARTFTRSSNIVTICMNRVFFKKPMYVTDWVEMIARVVYVRVHTLEVEVEVWLERLDGTRMLAHSGFFIILHYNDVGYKQEIITGIKLNNTDSLGRYYRARQRFLYWKQYDSKAGGDIG